MKPLVYIAAPYSSEPVANTGIAIDAGNWLMDRGYNVVVPHLSLFMHMRRPRTYDEWLGFTIGWMKRCDVVVRLPGDSRGSDTELFEASQCGIPVFKVPAGDENWRHRVLNFLEDWTDSREVRESE